MGWFSAVCSFVSSAASSVIKSVVSTVASGVSNAVRSIVSHPWDIPKGPIEVIGGIVGFFKEIFGNSSKSLGSTGSYETENASLDETQVINRMLSEFSLNMEQKADDFEKDCIKDARRYFDEFLIQLQQIQNVNTSELKIDIPIVQVKKEMDKLERETKGIIKKYVSSKISQDNGEVMIILKMKAGEDKTKKIKVLADKVLGEALELFAKKVEHVIKAQGKIISGLLEGNLNQMVKTMENQTKLFEEIEKAKVKGDKELSLKKQEIQYTISLCDLAIGEVQ